MLVNEGELPAIDHMAKAWRVLGDPPRGVLGKVVAKESAPLPLLLPVLCSHQPGAVAGGSQLSASGWPHSNMYFPAHYKDLIARLFCSFLSWSYKHFVVLTLSLRPLRY